MSLRDQLQTALKEAMKAKQADRLSTLRLINAAIKDRDIANRGEGGKRRDRSRTPQRGGSSGGNGKGAGKKRKLGQTQRAMIQGQRAIGPSATRSL